MLHPAKLVLHYVQGDRRDRHPLLALRHPGGRSARRHRGTLMHGASVECGQELADTTASVSHRGIRLWTLALRFEACSLGYTLPLALQLSRFVTPASIC